LLVIRAQELIQVAANKACSIHTVNYFLPVLKP
jgi:hypothetical protein